MDTETVVRLRLILFIYVSCICCVDSSYLRKTILLIITVKIIVMVCSAEKHSHFERWNFEKEQNVEVVAQKTIGARSRKQR